ncbi:MAG: transglutaminase family protein [Opitutales bacterium]|nr:transglutaminase family protein [Opitutales bacterium]
MIFSITHQTDYCYDKPVSLSVHRFFLFPRLGPNVSLQSYHLKVNPGGRGNWLRDEWDNHFYQVYFPDKTDHMEVTLSMLLDRGDTNPFAFLLAPEALHYPFPADPFSTGVCEPFLRTGLSADDESPILPWTRQQQFMEQGDTVSVIVAWLEQFSEKIAYGTRDEPGVQPPALTLSQGTGSCRDIAVLAAAFLRLKGIPSRLVTGFLHTPEEEIETDNTDPGSELHAWVDVFLPGAGWRGVDPTNGVFCDHQYIPLAVGHTLKATHPFQGTYYSDHPVTSRVHTDLQVRLEEDT